MTAFSVAIWEQDVRNFIASSHSNQNPPNKPAQFLINLRALRSTGEASVRPRFGDMEFGLHTRRTQGAVHADGVGEIEITRARCQDRRRKILQIAKEGREIGMRQIGNAVPTALAKQLGVQLMSVLFKAKDKASSNALASGGAELADAA